MNQFQPRVLTSQVASVWLQEQHRMNFLLLLMFGFGQETPRVTVTNVPSRINIRLRPGPRASSREEETATAVREEKRWPSARLSGRTGELQPPAVRVISGWPPRGRAWGELGPCCRAARATSGGLAHAHHRARRARGNSGSQAPSGPPRRLERWGPVCHMVDLIVFFLS